MGQTRMHWSHLMQRRRNSSSATEPGGRIALPAEVLLHTAGGPRHREEEQAEEPGQEELAAANTPDR